MPTHNKPGRGHHTSRCKHWSGPSLRPQGSMFPFHSPLEKIMHPTRRHASGHKPRRGHYTSRCKHWSGPALRPEGSMFPFHSPLGEIMHPIRRHASDHKPGQGHHTSRCKHWSGLSQGHCRRKLTCLPPSEPCQHITCLGEAAIPADANIGQAPH